MVVQHFKPPAHYLHHISFILSVHLLLINIPVFHAEVDYGKYYSECSKNTTFRCGNTTLGQINYPFWAENIRPKYCGLEGFELTCEKNETPVIDIGSHNKFRVAKINLFTIMLEHYNIYLGNNPCAPIFNSTFSNSKLFHYSDGVEDLYMFYGCSPELDVSDMFGVHSLTCKRDSENKQLIYGAGSLIKDHLGTVNKSCKAPIMVPINWIELEKFSENLTVLLEEIMKSSLEIQYTINRSACHECTKSGGQCWNGTEFGVDPQCLYKPENPTETKSGNPTEKKSGNTTRKKIYTVGAAAGGMILLLLILFILNRRRRAKHGSSGISPNISSNFFSISNYEKGACSDARVPTFSYIELEKATNYFDSGNELGNGGFGTVYKGKLKDGREVAVKRLYEYNYKRVEQFMNEIVILAGLHHPNLVVLYGSTSHECRKLLLVYEYIPNGTVADHLNGDGAQPGSLTWRIRLSIAIETASALSYLHASDVIHRDVKTTNILLDNSFRVKVADFGLSRLFPGNVTHISTVPQGTPGYVDPEYHQCYQLTDKSDVYSFGVVLIELISSKPAVDISRHRHEVNLANLAINKIQGNALHELVDPALGFESDQEVRNMIADVAELAFRCLQNEREMRPSMEEVHKSLKEIQRKYMNQMLITVCNT